MQNIQNILDSIKTIIKNIDLSVTPPHKQLIRREFELPRATKLTFLAIYPTQTEHKFLLIIEQIKRKNLYGRFCEMLTIEEVIDKIENSVPEFIKNPESCCR